MFDRFPRFRWLLAAFLIILCAPVSASALEAVQNGTFSADLSGWNTAPDVSQWPVLQTEPGNTFISLHPGKGFRGPLVYQNLNVTGVGGATVTASVGLRALDSHITCGRSIGIHLSYITNAGQHQEALLLNPEDCDAGFGAFNVYSTDFTLPANAQKITRISLVRLDSYGQLGADNVSLQVPGSATIGTVPRITGISSGSGAYGQSLTITGSGFGNNGSGNGQVTIGGASAGTISAWADSQITVTLAAPATSGVVRVVSDGVESDGNFSFDITSPNFSLVTSWSPVRVISGQQAKIPIGVKFNNGYSTNNGITFTLTGSPAPPAHSFAPAQVSGDGGTLLTIQTTGMPQSDYYYTLTASDPASGSVSRTVRVQVYEVGQITFTGEGPGGAWGQITSLNLTRQGGFNLYADVRDLFGREIRGIDYSDMATWSSSDTSKLLAVRSSDNRMNFVAIANGTATLTATSPDGFSVSLPVNINFPVTPSYTELTLNPASVPSGTASSVAVTAQATGFADDFGLSFPGNLTGAYSNGGLRYDGTGTTSTNLEIGNYLVTAGSLYGGTGRAAVLSVFNNPATGIIQGTVSGFQPPDQSNADGPQGTVYLHDAITGNEIKNTYAWAWYNDSALPNFTLAGVAPGAYKVRLVPGGIPLPPNFNQPQWYPNATDFAGAGIVNISAGATVIDINLFYTREPQALPEVVSTTPQDQATDVPINHPVVVQFDQEMEDISFDSSDSSFIVRDSWGNRVWGQYLFQDSNRRVVFSPYEPLEPNAQYTANVSTFAYSRQGLHVPQDYQWTFTTGTSLISPPEVISVHPTPDSTDVSPNAFVLARFNQQMDPSSFSWDSIVIEDDFQNGYYGEIDVEGDIVVFRPYAWLEEYAHYTVRISGGVASLLGQSIGNDYTWSFTTGELGPPKVMFTIPAPGQASVALDTTVTVLFDQWMDSWSIDTSSFYLQDDSAQPVSGYTSAGGYTAEFIPDNPLEVDRSYTATLTTDIQSQYGLWLEQDYSWTFTTGEVLPDAPVILAVDPQPASTYAAANTVVQVLFDRELDPESVSFDTITVRDSSDNPVPGDVELEDRVVRFIPWFWFGAETYTATVAGSIRSREGAELGSPYSWSFTPLDTTAPPRVVFTLPEANEEDVDPRITVKAYFDQAMMGYTINEFNFLLTDGSLNAVGGSVYTNTSYSAVLEPWSPLDSNTTYTATLTTDVMSNQYQSLLQDYVWSFTTGEPGLSIIYTYPADGETDVGLNEYVLALFYQDIDPDTVTPSTFIVKDPDGNTVAGSRQVIGPDVYFYPDSPLQPGTRYSAMLTTGIQDYSQARLRRNYVWFFTATQESGDLQVDYISPYDGYQGWWRDKSIFIEFNMDMDGATVNTSTFQLWDAGNNPVPGSVSHQYRMAWFTPSVPLQPSATYTAVVTTEMLSEGGASLPEDYVWSFTTAVNADSRLGSIKALPDGSWVAFSDKGLHIGWNTGGYIEEFDRSSGIRLDGFLLGYAGRVFDISGTLQTDGNGERYILPGLMWFKQFQNVLPLRATNRAVGERMMDGLNVQVWGRVLSAPNANTIVISDGSSPAGLRVYNPNQTISATVGSTVLVTGAAGWDGNRIIYMRQISQLAP